MQLDLEIRQFIDDNFVFVSNASSLDASASLTESGVIDSLGVLELILFLEERFGILVPDSEMLPENLDSIARIVDYIERKLVAAGADDADQAVA